MITPVDLITIVPLFSISLIIFLITSGSVPQIASSPTIGSPLTQTFTTSSLAQSYSTVNTRRNISLVDLKFQDSDQPDAQSDAKNVELNRQISRSSNRKSYHRNIQQTTRSRNASVPKGDNDTGQKKHNQYFDRPFHTRLQLENQTVSNISNGTVIHRNDDGLQKIVVHAVTKLANKTVEQSEAQGIFRNQSGLQPMNQTVGELRNQTLEATLNQTLLQPMKSFQPMQQPKDQANDGNFITSDNQTISYSNKIQSSSAYNLSHVPLNTKITAPFSVLGVILILSGSPMCFWGGRNRWSSYFLTGAYTAAVGIMVAIIRFGVLEQINRPNNLLQGIFVLVCVVSSIAAGAVAVIFWKGTRFLVGGLGGFVISLFILSLKSDSLIQAAGLRWIFILAMVSIGFVLATIPAITIQVTLFATATVGAAAVVVGIDCFTTAGLKEFWLYIIGFGALFPKLKYFPFTVAMQAELGVMGALFLMGAAVQWRLLEIIRQKINEIKQLDLDRQLKEEAAAYRQSMVHDADLALWEKHHGEERKAASMRDSGSVPSKSYCRASQLSYELIEPLPDPFSAPMADPETSHSRHNSLEPLKSTGVGSYVQI